MILGSTPLRGVTFAAVCSLCVAAGSAIPVIGPEPEAAAWARKVHSRMSLEEKVAQIIVVDVAGGYTPDSDPAFRRWVKLVRDLGVGGVVVYGGTPRDVPSLLNRLQKEARIPLMTAADFEGGPGQQVGGATEFPANMAFSAAGSTDLVYRAASAAAKEGRAMGICLTYSPVVDISTLPESPGESVRSFGGDMPLLAKLVRAYVRGYMDHGMLTTAKHFPGRGDIRPWPAAPLFAWIDKPAAALESQEMAAFRSSVDAGVSFVMSEHIAVPSLTGGSDLPASVERKLAFDVLRGKLGFRGLLTTDDLWYDHVVERFGAAAVGVKALQAGHDILLKPRDAAEMVQAVVKAVRDGSVPQSHIDQAVLKLLTWKARLGLHRNRFVDVSMVDSIVGSADHWQLAAEVADRSLTVLINDGVLPLEADALRNIVNISVQKLDSDPSPQILAEKLTSAFPRLRNYTLRPGTDPALYDDAFAKAAEASLVIVSLFAQRDKFGDSAPLRPRDRELIERLAALKPGRLIAMSYGNPHFSARLEKVPAFVVGYGERGWFGNQAIYFDSFVRLLKGSITPQGTLPVHVNARFQIGSGIRW